MTLEQLMAAAARITPPEVSSVIALAGLRVFMSSREEIVGAGTLGGVNRIQ